jgi:phospholipase/carboxylesterase
MSNNLNSKYTLQFINKICGVCQLFLISNLVGILLFFAICSSEITARAKENKQNNVKLSGVVFNPVDGIKLSSAVVLLHGYGDTAENFLLIGLLLSKFLPNTLFVAINAPLACNKIAAGKQWLETPKNNKKALLKEIKILESSLHKYLDSLLKKYNIQPDKLAFLGFSQGARVALHIGLRRSKCAGIVAISGSYLDDPKVADLSKTPILIIHGESDQKAPVALAKESYAKLKGLKMPVNMVLLPGVPHEVDPQGIALASNFLKDCLQDK